MKNNNALKPAPERKLARRNTRSNALVQESVHEWAHQNTAMINSRRRVLRVDLEETEKQISIATAVLTHLKDRREELEASLDGMAEVVAKR